MATEAKNMKAPEDIDELDFSLDNLDDGGLGEDFGAIDADEDEDGSDMDLDEDEMENPIKKSDDDDDDDMMGGEDDDDDDDDAKKSDADDDDDDDDKKDDDDDLKKQAKKGGYSRGDLAKSCARLLRHVDARDPNAQRKALLKAAARGEDLSKSQTQQLYKLMGGQPHGAKAQKLSKSFTGDHAVQRTVDASEFLSGLVDGLGKSMDGMEKSFDRMSARDSQFSLLLARTVAQVGQTVVGQSAEIRSLRKALARHGDAPVAAPRSYGLSGTRARPLAKSHMGEGRPRSLSHAQIESGFDGMMKKSLTGGRPGYTATGTSIVKAATHFDSCGEVRPEIQDELTSFIRETR